MYIVNFVRPLNLLVSCEVGTRQSTVVFFPG